MAYVTLDDFKAYIRNELGSVDDAYLASCLDAATTAVNKHCQRTFAVAGTPSARVFTPDGTTLLTVHDCTSVTSITLSGGTVPTAAYQLEPLNGVTLDGETRPYTTVRLIGGMSWWVTIPGKADVTVTAAWGWAATPHAVVEATRILAKDIAAQRDIRSGLVVLGDFAAVAVQNRTVKVLLAPYVRAEAWGMA